MKIIYVGNPVTRETVKVTFINLPDANTKEAAAYVDYVQARINAPLKEITVKKCEDGKVDVDYYGKGEKFERIRRITGYLTGDVASWNNAKRAEESERVKHDADNYFDNHYWDFEDKVATLNKTIRWR